MSQGGFDDEPLCTFLADKQVHSLESWHFVYEGKTFWSVLGCYSMPDVQEFRNGSSQNKAAVSRSNGLTVHIVGENLSYSGRIPSTSTLGINLTLIQYMDYGT